MNWTTVGNADARQKSNLIIQVRNPSSSEQIKLFYVDWTMREQNRTLQIYPWVKK